MEGTSIGRCLPSTLAKLISSNKRENNYLYTIIPDTVSNCWIGLNDRSVEGTYIWTDGSVYSHTNWTGSEPSFSNEDCVEIIRAGEGSWRSVDCGTMLNAFLCKRLSSVTTVGGFGQLTNGRLDFETIRKNTFLFTPHTLACGREESTDIVWTFSENSDLSDSECQANSLTYTIGLYDASLTTVAISGTTYNYIVGLDRQDVLVLCDPMDGGSLSLLEWSIGEGSATLPNPINIASMIDISSAENYSTSCSRNGPEISTNLIRFIVPQIIVRYGDNTIESFSALYPTMKTLNISVGVIDIVISKNVEGKWLLPDGNDPTVTIIIPGITSQNAGLYKLYVTNWDGEEVCVIQINIDSVTVVSNLEKNIQVNYSVSDTISKLYYSSKSSSDNIILWTTDTVKYDDNKNYSIEYPNPVVLSAVFSNVGAGLHTLTSFYRMSPVTSLGSLQLAIKDTVEVTISYEGYTFTTSDISNELFPSPQVISILQGTKDITLTCSLPVCVWMIANVNNIIITSTYSISEMPSKFNETFSLFRSTSSGVEYTTAHITILTLTESVTNSALVPIIIIMLLLITCIIVTTIILVPIFIFLYIKKRRPTKGKLSQCPKPSRSNIIGDESNPDYTILSEINPQSKEYIDLSVNTNPEYMTIDETSLTTLDAPTNPNERGYANLSNIPHQNVTKKREKRLYRNEGSPDL
ncbi:Ladderlectin [Oopsacas minuta]|uniref:Ladderlectin n=1 Tax=Oopsacas minuta TaxID=111878 RepID=A0AAV7KDH8_9METZ|nr:Ladderlectin [Oopsacas minuta]